MTIKELAAELNVTRQAIYQRCKANGIDLQAFRADDKGNLSDDGVKAIEAIYSQDKPKQAPLRGELTSQIDSLKAERETLTAEKARLQAEIDRLTEEVNLWRNTALSVQQALTEAQEATTTALRLAENAQKLQAATLPAPRISWFKRLLGKGSNSQP